MPSPSLTMRSQLTRHVFRRLLAEQPAIVHKPPSRRFRSHVAPRHVRSTFVHQQRRGFLNALFDKRPKRDIREPVLDPGMETMLDLEKRIHLIARLPDPEKLALAFTSFVKSKAGIQKAVYLEDFHATRLLQTLSTIEDQFEDEDAGLSEFPLTRAQLKEALNVVALRTSRGLEVHSQLATKLYERLIAMPTKEGRSAEESHAEEFMSLITVLAVSGETAKAQVRFMDMLQTSAVARENAPRGFAQILSGHIIEDNETAIHNLLKTMDAMGVEVPVRSQRDLAIYFAGRNDVELTKRWLTINAFLPEDDASNTPVRRKKKVFYDGMQAAFEFGLRNNEMVWAQQIYEDAVNQETTTESSLQSRMIRASAIAGKSVDDITRMIESMMQKNEGIANTYIPSTNLINHLIEHAISKNQPYIAERYFGLMQKWNLIPDAKTYMLQIDYRLSAEDYAGAQTSYDLLREEPISNDEDWDIMNKLLRTLTTVPDTPSSVIVGLAEDIIDRKKLFPAETTKALCRYHISRDEFFEVVDLLQTYAFQYSVEQRCAIRDLMASVCLDPQVQTSRAWDTYMILHQVFNLETKRDLRQRIMADMFRRGRPDLGTHVFTRMTRNARADTVPDLETYVLAFVGIHSSREPDALEVIHNLLKLDTNVEPDTRLRNALMMAYVGVGMPYRAVEYWEQISTSEEGPTYESLEIVLAACERVQRGAQIATEVWTRLLAADVSINRNLAANYVAALVGNSRIDDACQVVQELKVTTGVRPDALILGSMYNSGKGYIVQERIEGFIRQDFPEIWAELEGLGITENEIGVKTVRGVARVLKP